MGGVEINLHFLCKVRSFFLCVFEKLQKSTISFIMCVLSAWNNSAPIGQVFMKHDVWVFFENVLRKFMFKSDKNNGCITWKWMYILDNI
jgi:hypothetical protein